MVTVETSESGATSVFEILRGEIAIERLIETNGHRKALCVSHDENSPSMHLYEEHVHCFGCGFHGDVVDVWSVQRGIERPIEAALDLAREFSVQLPEMSKEGRQKAEERRTKEETQLIGAWAFHELLVGSHDGQLPKAPTVRKWWEDRGFGVELQKRFLLGANKADDAAVIPFWHRGRIVGVIHRKLEGEPKYKNPEGERPLFIPGPIKEEIFL